MGDERTEKDVVATPPSGVIGDVLFEMKARPNSEPLPGYFSNQSPGQQFVDSDGFKNAISDHVFRMPGGSVSVKTTLDYDNFGGIDFGKTSVGLPRPRKLLLQDLCVVSETSIQSAASIRYLQDRSDYSAAQVANWIAAGEAKPEYLDAQLAWVEVTENIKKTAAIKTVSDEVLEDQSRLKSIIDNSLITALLLQVNQYVATQLSAHPNIQAYAKASEGNETAILKAYQLVQENGAANPNGLLMNGLDFPAKFQQTPAAPYMIDPYSHMPFDDVKKPYVPTLWGLPICLNQPSPASGTVVVGDFSFAEIVFREGVRIDISNANRNNFENNLVTVRAETRFALLVHRTNAFCKATGL